MLSVGLSNLGSPLLEYQAVIRRELFDALQDLQDAFTHVGVSRACPCPASENRFWYHQGMTEEFPDQVPEAEHRHQTRQSAKMRRGTDDRDVAVRTLDRQAGLLLKFSGLRRNNLHDSDLLGAYAVLLEKTIYCR